MKYGILAVLTLFFSQLVHAQWGYSTNPIDTYNPLNTLNEYNPTSPYYGAQERERRERELEDERDRLRRENDDLRNSRNFQTARPQKRKVHPFSFEALNSDRNNLRVAVFSNPELRSNLAFQISVRDHLKQTEPGLNAIILESSCAIALSEVGLKILNLTPEADRLLELNRRLKNKVLYVDVIKLGQNKLQLAVMIKDVSDKKVYFPISEITSCRMEKGSKTMMNRRPGQQEVLNKMHEFLRDYTAKVLEQAQF